MSDCSKPAVFKGLLWGMFSATAVVSAFVLPVHIYALLRGMELRPGLFFEVYLFAVLFCALYHGLYRTKTIFHDLGFGKYHVLIDVLFFVLLTVGTAAMVYLIFIYV